jgi:anti-sigma factor RsiW
MDTCLDEGTLQAYLDGELSPETSDSAAAHLAACAACAQAARAAEQELALFSTAFAPALHAASVPTEKLRARLDEAIAEITSPQRQFAPPVATPSRLRSFFDSLVGSVTTLTPRQATAFASFLVAAALAVVFALMQTPDNLKPSQEIARVNQTPAPPVARIENSPAENGAARDGEAAAVQTSPGEIDVPAPARGGGDHVSVVKAGLNARSQVATTTREGRGNGAAETANTTANTTANVPTTSEPVLADEKTYLSSISSLTSAIESQGAEGMSPTLRAEYERNLAVVNQAIVSSRVAARRNPQDTDAKEFLRAAYQNKVELLSAVADRTQFASGRD